MPKPYKLTRPYALPADAEIVDVGGKPHVRMKDRGRAVLYRVSEDGKKYLKPSKRWYFDYRDENGTVRRCKGFSDLKATEQLAAEMERKVSRLRAGIIDPSEEHFRRKLADHLQDYAAALEAKGNTPEHNRATIAKIKAIFKGCEVVFIRDVDAGNVSAWLAKLRRGRKRVAEIPPGESFASSKVASILGVKIDSVRRFVARHRLPTVGRGAARKLTRQAVERIAVLLSRGCGPTTINHHIRAIQGFFRWLVDAKRIGSNPVESLAFVNEAVDVRRGRRELTAEELGRLFVAARDSARSFRGLTGVDRYYLYLVAAGTGFRANALANLTPADFDLNSSSPFVTLPARFNKSRKVKVQPLPLDVADALRDFIADRPENAPIWGGTWARGCAGAEMIRRDLEVAGIAYAVDGPDGPEYADFHALRHSFLTLGGRSGIDLRTLQELAGHSTPTLTARYSHRRLYDLAGAVEKLPNLVPTNTPGAEAVVLRKTGTDNPNPSLPVNHSGAKSVVPGVVPGVVEGDIPSHRTASIRTFADEQTEEAKVELAAKKARAGADLHRPALFSTDLPGLDSNQDKESQNLLCYRYTTGYRKSSADPCSPLAPREDSEDSAVCTSSNSRERFGVR